MAGRDASKEPWTPARGIRQAVVIAAIMFSALGLYLVVLKWRGWAGHNHVTYIAELDDLFPFRPGWVWVYLIPYVVCPVMVGLLSRDSFAWFVRRGLVLIAITLTIFITYPTQTRPRQPADLGDGPTAQLYESMIKLDDPPANAAPSLHVSLTCLLAWTLVRDYPRWWLPSFAAALVVWLATLYTRQHHILDVLTGAVLACVLVLPWSFSRRDGMME
jgi:membrane-associated phospholipid phosphatase